MNSSCLLPVKKTNKQEDLLSYKEAVISPTSRVRVNIIPYFPIIVFVADHMVMIRSLPNDQIGTVHVYLLAAVHL